MKRIRRTSVGLILAVLLAVGATVHGDVRQALAYAPVSYVDTSGSRDVLMVNGQPFFYNGIQWSLVRSLDRDHWAWTDVSQIFQAAANSNYTVFGVPIMWSHIENSGNNSPSTWNWTDLHNSIDYASQNSLKLELLWFGSQISTSSDSTIGTPSYVINTYQQVLNSSGVAISVYSSSCDITGQPCTSYKMDMTDTSLLTREEYVLGAVMNEVRSYITSKSYSNVVVGVEVLNEPTVSYLYGYSPQTPRSYSASANAKWTSGGYTDTNQFNADVLWTYLNGLGGAVKNSNYSVWTRVNFWDGWEPTMVSDLITNNENARAGTGTSLDIIGNDPYDNVPDHIYNQVTDTTLWHKGKNFGMVMENAASYTNTPQLEFNALAGNGTYHVWEVNDTLPNTAGLYTTNNTTKTIAAKAHQPAVASTNGMLNKDSVDLASLRVGSPRLTYFNRGFATTFDSAQPVCGISIRYSTTAAGGGIAACRSNALVLLSTASAAVRVPNTLPIASIQKGYFDSTNTWVSQGTVSTTASGSELSIALNAYDCVRVVIGGGAVLNLSLSATASATSVSVSNPASLVNDGNETSGYVSADNPTFPQYVTLNWSVGQGFSSVITKVWYAQGQAPTSFDVQVSSDGSTNWTTVASSNSLSFGSNDTTVESIALGFAPVSGMKGVRLKINSANLTWNHFGINEIEIPSSDVALSASASASSYSTANPADLVNDAIETGGYVSADNPTFPQYVTLNWATGQSFAGLATKVWYAQGQAPTAFDVQVSADGVTGWTTVASTSGLTYTHNDTTIESVPVSFALVTGMKGVRLQINSANLQWRHFGITEIEIPTSNLALAATASATSLSANNPPSLINDGNDSTGYVSANNPTFPQYVTLVWSAGQTFNSVVAKVWYAQGQAPTSFDVQVSPDGSTGWTTVASATSITYSHNDTTVEAVPLSFAGVSGMKGVRLKINSANLTWLHFAINELQVTNS